MTNQKIISFENTGWGFLEFQILDTKRNFFQVKSEGRKNFLITGFGKDLNYEPFFLFEWQKVHYEYIIEDNTTFNPPFELRINNRIEKKSNKKGKSHLLTGQFSFNDQVGETKIEIRDNSNALIFLLKTEVFPQKMDYNSDYKAMMEDISSIVKNLAYDSLKDTFKKAKARMRGISTEDEWWNILDALFEVLVINLSVIRRSPKHEIKKSIEVLSVDKIKNASRKSMEWFRKHGQFSNLENKGVKVTSQRSFTHALAEKKYVTYDIYENRFVAWAVKKLINHLRDYKKNVFKTAGKKDFSALIYRIQKYQGRLQGFLHEPPFNETSEFEKVSWFSTSLTRGAGYRDFMHIYLLLSRGLELAENDIFKIEPKDISMLYEYWGFLKLVQLLKEQTGNSIEYQDLIQISANKFSVKLKKGEPSKIQFKKEDTSETTTIYYNREFRKDGKKVFTYNQKPDYSIKFKKNGFEKPFWYLFDAKYRFEENVDLDRNQFNVPQDAIGQLHRYRDAILHTEPVNSTYRAAIKNLGGIILYPYPQSEAEFITNDYYKSIEHVNIGALPFLPSKSTLVSFLLNKMINKTAPEEHFEKFIEMDNSEYLKHRNTWKEWVTIGTIQKKNQKERIRFVSDNSLFHIPLIKNLNSKIYLTKKILICISGTKKAFLCNVSKWNILSDNELVNLGATWELRTDKYVVFELKDLKEIQTPDYLAPLNFRYSTLEGLNRYLNDPQNASKYFYLTNPDAARLYEELENNEIDFELKWVDQKSDPSLICFTVKHTEILSSELFQDFTFKVESEFIHINKLISKLL
ncbi:MAG: DUF2357 domain-containing protein [Prolixibacteraceae bacterium]|nr:DUF2357 domain-containing protein [Prolixibacteraceae bacterium]